MTVQTLKTPTGDTLVVLPEADYLALISAAEDARDMAAVDAFERRLALGEEELIPSEIANRILDGENRIRVWRDHRGLSAAALAEKAGLAQSYLSQIETGKRSGTIDTMKKLAEALGIGLDDLV